MGTVQQVDTAQFDPVAVRADFPILQQQVNGQPLVYLDNAATTQKPRAVIDAIVRYYEEDNSNVHRGAHTLSQRATAQFETARQTVADFLNARAAHEVIWTRGVTEAINLVAQSWGRTELRPGDRVLVSALEHHSNIVPWQMVAEATGARVEAVAVHPDGSLDLADLEQKLDASVRMVSVAHVSNALGTVNPVADIVRLARQAGALSLIDGAQAVAHMAVDVQALDCDFYTFSSHKIYGPTGIGVLYGRTQLLDAMPPWQGGGEMIEHVSFDGTTYGPLPHKFEAGTPDIAGVVGLKAALDYVLQFDRAALSAWESELLAYAEREAGKIEGLTLIGTAREKVGVMSFLIAGTHPADLGTLLDYQGVAVRTGHHCAQPLMTQFGIPGTVRASFSCYNNHDDVDRLCAAIEKSRKFF